MRAPELASAPATATASPSAPAAQAAARSTRVHIGPLDGLRGIAVLGVLLFHAGHLGGGFLGVDLFFVLSGFLITGLLLGEVGERGRVALGAFWARRARRLLPALGAMGIGVLLLTWAFGTPAMLRFAHEDAPWAGAQAVNWHFIAEQIGYWNASGTRVFAHLWSIAVEWQFYLGWPLLVAVAGRGRGGRARVAVLAGAGALCSLVLLLQLGQTVDTTRAYEGTDTRAFALLLGALVATLPPRERAAGASRRTRLAADAGCLVLLGVLGLAWAFTDGENAPGLFKGGLFLHSLACAVLIALLAAVPDGRVGAVVGSAVPRRLGALSYSLYLWHWPIYLLLPDEVFGVGGWGRTGWAIGISLAAAALSKVLVEDPVRFHPRWTSGPRGALALAVAAVVAVGVWAAVPAPRPGAGTVDIDRLAAP